MKWLEPIILNNMSRLAKIPKSNLSASSAPTVNDDSDDGYAVGSGWVDTTSDKAYVCLDATVAAAVWIETTQSGGAAIARLPAEGAYLPITNPAAIVEMLGSGAYPGYSTANFDDTTQEFAEWHFTMPGYDGGNITVIPKWLCAATSGTVGWIIESIGVAHDENFTQAVVGDAATITAVTAASATTDLNTTTYTTYNPAGVAADDMVKFRIKRNVAVDSMVGDAKLLEVLLIYQKT